MTHPWLTVLAVSAAAVVVEAALVWVAIELLDGRADFPW